MTRFLVTIEAHRDIVAEHPECIPMLFKALKAGSENIRATGFSALFNISMDNGKQSESSLLNTRS